MGVKVDWGRITTTVSAFDIMKPIQLRRAFGIRRTHAVRRESRNRGVEINTFGEVTDDVRLLGGVMFH